MAPTPPITSYRARIGFPISSPPVRDFAFTVAGDRFQAIGTTSASLPVTDFGNAAVLPWLTNSHTHLELSHFEQPIGDPAQGFPAWIRDVVAWRRSQTGTPEELFARRQDAVIKGASESWRNGIGVVLDIASPGFGDLYQQTLGQGAAVIVLQEVLGLSTARVDELYAQVAQSLEPGSKSWTNRPHGISPHAPYTVGVELLTRLCKLSAERRIPLAMHLAESRDELELLRSHSGAFHALLTEVGAWDPSAFPRGIAILDYLKILATAQAPYIIHGNYLNDEELDFLAAHPQFTVVYCPRTHAYFGHARYPLTEMLERGIRVEIGTDSRASNPDLNLWDDLRYVADAYPELPLDVILKLAIPYHDFIQSGNLASFIVVDLPDEECDDPYELLFDPRSRVRAGYRMGTRYELSAT